MGFKRFSVFKMFLPGSAPVDSFVYRPLLTRRCKRAHRSESRPALNSRALGLPEREANQSSRLVDRHGPRPPAEQEGRIKPSSACSLQRELLCSRNSASYLAQSPQRSFFRCAAAAVQLLTLRSRRSAASLAQRRRMLRLEMYASR